jgi:hypothetical protein
MAAPPPSGAGWALTGFQAAVALWVWTGLVALHVFWRCLSRVSETRGPGSSP